MKLAFIGLWCLAALVIVAAAFNIVPPTASLLISVAALLLSASVSYLTSFRGPDIRLLLAPAHAFDNSMVSGYSAGMPSTWNITVNLLAVNDGPRPGMLVRFEVDADSVEYCPRKPTAFTVTFSGLEWKKAPHPSAVSSSFTLPLPLPLQALAREPASFRAMLTFSTADSGILADDLREIRGLRVKYRYWAGTEKRQKERRGDVELSYDVLRAGVREYWSGARQFQHYVRRLDGATG